MKSEFLKMKLFGIFALAAVVVADLDYDSLGLKKPNKGSSAEVDKVNQPLDRN